MTLRSPSRTMRHWKPPSWKVRDGMLPQDFGLGDGFQRPRHGSGAEARRLFLMALGTNLVARGRRSGGGEERQRKGQDPGGRPHRSLAPGWFA